MKKAQNGAKKFKFSIASRYACKIPFYSSNTGYASGMVDEGEVRTYKWKMLEYNKSATGNCDS